MCDLFWLTDKQMRRIEPYFQLLHGIPESGSSRDLWAAPSRPASDAHRSL